LAAAAACLKAPDENFLVAILTRMSISCAEAHPAPLPHAADGAQPTNHRLPRILSQDCEWKRCDK
jgi:hypothetical protein